MSFLKVPSIRHFILVLLIATFFIFILLVNVNDLNMKYTYLGSLFNYCSLKVSNEDFLFNFDWNEKSFEQVESDLRNLSIKNGGEWQPEKCTPRERVALIIAYRNRTRNLKFFLNYMHPFLANQNVHYKIYLVEPLPNLTFNRALLMNVGFLEAVKESKDKWSCYIFHDVDMLPENSLNLYQCDPYIPLHLAVAVSQFSYRIDDYFSRFYGGVNAFTKEQFLNVNGFSNLYFGWGKEDDDFYKRSILKYTKIKKVHPSLGRYYSLEHKKEEKNRKGVLVLAEAKLNFIKNGITEGLNTIVYSLKKTEKNPLFTRFFVNYNEKLILKIGFNNSFADLIKILNF